METCDPHNLDGIETIVTPRPPVKKRLALCRRRITGGLNANIMIQITVRVNRAWSTDESATDFPFAGLDVTCLQRRPHFLGPLTIFSQNKQAECSVTNCSPHRGLYIYISIKRRASKGYHTCQE